MHTAVLSEAVVVSTPKADLLTLPLEVLRIATNHGERMHRATVSKRGVRPHNRVIRYEIEVRRYTELERAGAAMVIGDASLLVDDEPIYTVKKARVGTFRGIAYPDYPLPSANSVGGQMER